MKAAPEIADWHNIEEWNKPVPEVGDLVVISTSAGEEYCPFGLIVDIWDDTCPPIAQVLSSAEGDVYGQAHGWYIDDLLVIQTECK